MANPTAYRKELREKILKTAMTEFLHRGLKAVKMDDIAKKLVISKRTLYEIFADKEELLYECVKYCSEEEIKEIKRRSEREGADVMDILVDFFHIRMESMTSVAPMFLSEIFRYKKVADFLAKNHENRRKDGIEFIKRGQREGYIREDIDFEVMGNIFDLTMRTIMQEELYKKYSLQKIFRNIVFVTIRGIATQKGIDKIERKLAEKP
ncbi:MAG: TetR/AcrR family transcriptional regulator [Prevotella sp.]|jgi:AcrR family transcriptional regulator